MIDWWWVGGNILVIVGLAALLATYSYRGYLAGTPDPGGKRSSARGRTTVFVRLGVLCVLFGLAVASGSWLERGVWIVLFFATLFQSVVNFLRTRRGTMDDRSNRSAHPEREISEI